MSFGEFDEVGLLAQTNAGAGPAAGGGVAEGEEGVGGEEVAG